MKTPTTTVNKTKKSNYTCPCCGEKQMVLCKLSFKTKFKDKAITIPKVEMERCDNCGETFLTPAGSRHVDDWLYGELPSE